MLCYILWVWNGVTVRAFIVALSQFEGLVLGHSWGMVVLCHSWALVLDHRGGLLMLGDSLGRGCCVTGWGLGVFRNTVGVCLMFCRSLAVVGP